jgi:Spy/CpxP family protein refolding chaperone
MNWQAMISGMGWLALAINMIAFCLNLHSMWKHNKAHGQFLAQRDEYYNRAREIQDIMRRLESEKMTDTREYLEALAAVTECQEEIIRQYPHALSNAQP